MIFQSTEIDYPVSNRLLTAFLPAEKFSLKKPSHLSYLLKFNNLKWTFHV